MSKCCFDPFKIHKKKVIALICVITKVYLQRFFLGRFEIFKKSITFLFLIVVEKSPNISYRAMQYLQNELLTSILCVTCLPLLFGLFSYDELRLYAIVLVCILFSVMSSFPL